MRRETELFFGSIIHQDRSALTLLNADYTYLNSAYIAPIPRQVVAAGTAFLQDKSRRPLVVNELLSNDETVRLWEEK